MGRHYPHDLYEEIPILEAARRCGLVLNDRTLEWDEVEASCPFCAARGNIISPSTHGKINTAVIYARLPETAYPCTRE